jgi:hypothetical protein
MATVMSNKKDTTWRRRESDDDISETDQLSHRPMVDREERDEYAEWRQERGKRGRKLKDKAGGRHRRRRDRDDL